MRQWQTSMRRGNCGLRQRMHTQTIFLYPAMIIAERGKVLVRMPKSLHRLWCETAEHENVNLNQYIVSMFSRIKQQINHLYAMIASDCF